MELLLDASIYLIFLMLIIVVPILHLTLSKIFMSCLFLEMFKRWYLGLFTRFLLLIFIIFGQIKSTNGLWIE